MSITAIDKEYVAGTYGRFPLELVEGKGSIVKDTQGKEYIDMGTGIGVTAFGYCDEVWTEAVTRQAMKLQHTSNLYYTEPCASLAKLLCEKTGMKKVFFSNSGAEANECAIKVARKYSAEKKGPDCFQIITLGQSFHGRTLTTLAATGQDHFHKDFQPLTPGFVHVEANNVDALNAAVNGSTAGIMIEMVQGEGGVNPLTREFVAECARICKEQDIPLIVDEVQTGNGRTGKLYAYMHFGITPDIVSTAKGLGGGLPIGATMMGEKVQNVLKPGDHGSTYGGNPVCCAGALTVIERLTDDFLSSVRRKSGYVFSTLYNAPGIESVTGLGLMIGIKTTKPAKEVVNACMARGVLCLTAKDKVRLLPPLNISIEELSQALDVLKEVCAE
ncbi:MAG: aspartate aminotransferase family protein [Oscillospiraceae bacterium]|nr:aspartate aminotransferase family protein [Oscillospiraceae bacterium]MBR2890167.1 aspartate aminotransferase family protein [Oscillospiraceae bacterium]